MPIDNKSKNLQRNNYEELIPFVQMEKGIPPIIHQTYKNRNVSEDIQRNIDKLIRLNPDWKYRFYDNKDIEEFIKKYYGDIIFSYYTKIDPRYGAGKADFFRYLLIYKMGGVYIDIKSTLTKPLDTVIFDDDSYILSHWDNKSEDYKEWGLYKELSHIPRGEYQQWHIIASAGHPILRNVIIRVLEKIDNYNPFNDGISTIGVLRTTGPIIYSLAIEEIRHQYPNQYRIVDNNVMGLKYSIFKGWDHKQVIQSFYNKGIAPIIIPKSKFELWGIIIYFRIKEIIRLSKDVINQLIGRKQRRI